MDVKTMFSNGDLREEVYLTQLEGYVQTGKKDLVCKLNKTLYGLRQTLRAWYEKIDNFLQKLAHD